MGKGVVFCDLDGPSSHDHRSGRRRRSVGAAWITVRAGN